MKDKNIRRLLTVSVVLVSIVIVQYIIIIKPKNIENERQKKLATAEKNYNTCLFNAVEDHDKTVTQVCQARESTDGCLLPETINKKLDSGYKADKTKCLSNYKLEVNSIK